MRAPSYIQDIVSWKNSFEFYIPVQVRFSETDAFGHLNNTNAFVYFEDARIALFKELGLMQKWSKASYSQIIVVADLQCDFHKQVPFDEQLQVGVKVQRLGTSSVDLHYVAVTSQGDICLTGRGTIVQISKETGRGAAFDEETRKLLAE
ncbi:acyl-CoA thioesterase [Halalkalibacter alkaliphilus]|uniref:Acyl-CoA thioesterase n=1 Tax=Halalkalibacter alkaliphilus TaxID=2917993 RepID=A0A9X2CTS3_9BACI|nr:thioesterase family protein [Halalkalibacter alkaliphilus]MCL7748054.1 acyl-CoA thioesterase [Halalkalibacter alkaliphilus]